MEFSIIIPFSKATPYLEETLSHISGLVCPSFEVILLPDQMSPLVDLSPYPFPVRIVETGRVSPAVKRDIGARKSSGKFLAFIDDDAFPGKDWLEQAEKVFHENTVAAVGGPQITPENDSFWQKVSGAVFLSPLNGRASHRYWPHTHAYDVDDWPSVNLIVRRSDFEAVSGFDSSYWPGEDTKLCLDLKEKTKKRIVYLPFSQVFHHRRAGFFRHMRQIGNYGLHRGYFAKRHPRTSLRWFYFIPSLFFLFISFGWLLADIHIHLAKGYYLLWGIYLTALLFSTISIYRKINSLSVALTAIPYTAATHFWYGWRFLKGFIFMKSMNSRLGR